MSRNRQVSPFAQLTGSEKQIKWLEYQSIRLPYIQLSACEDDVCKPDLSLTPPSQPMQNTTNRPQPPAEIPRIMPTESQSRHKQYDAVIARLKQAELQSRLNASRLLEKS